MTALTYYKLPHPLKDGDVLFYDPEDVRQALEDGAPPVRSALGPSAPPEEAEVRAVEARLRRWLLGRARASWGRALWWAALGPALSILWITFAEAVALLFVWLPPLARLIASLGAVTGGPLLAAVVALVPLIWGWRRAWTHAAEARRWDRLARLASGRRFRTAPVGRTADPALAAFATASTPLVDALRAMMPRLAEGSSDGAAEVARLAREVYQLAARHHLSGVASAYHAIYRRFDAAERRLSQLERASGVLAERKAAREVAQVRRELGRSLARYAPGERPPRGANILAPLAGLAAGLLVLTVVLWLTGTYFVEPGQAVVVDPPAARLARLAAVFGLPLAGPEGGRGTRPVEVQRTEGYHWGWPRPFADRHAVSLGEQRVRVQAIFRQSGPDRYDVLLAEVRFRISDLDRWSQLDRDGNGGDLLAARLAAVLQGALLQQRDQARQTLRQQNPSLANDLAQLDAQADQLVEARLQEIVQAVIGTLSDSGATREVGVQLSREVQSRLVRGVPGAVAGAPPGR